MDVAYMDGRPLYGQMSLIWTSLIWTLLMTEFVGFLTGISGSFCNFRVISGNSVNSPQPLGLYILSTKLNNSVNCISLKAPTHLADNPKYFFRRKMSQCFPFGFTRVNTSGDIMP